MTFIDFSVGLEFHAEPFFAGIQYRSIALEFEELDERFDTELTLTGPQAFAGFTW